MVVYSIKQWLYRVIVMPITRSSITVFYYIINKSNVYHEQD